jgi:hypothetical protein
MIVVRGAPQSRTPTTTHETQGHGAGSQGTTPDRCGHCNAGHQKENPRRCKASGAGTHRFRVPSCRKLLQYCNRNGMIREATTPRL